MTSNYKSKSTLPGMISGPGPQDDPLLSGGDRLYEIKISGHLDTHWSQHLGGLAIQHDVHGDTLLTGTIPDQAALHGILGQIRDLGLSLIWLKPSGLDD